MTKRYSDRVKLILDMRPKPPLIEPWPLTYFYFKYRIRGNFRGLPIFAVFRGQYETAKIKIAKYFPISVNELSLEGTSIFAFVTCSFPLLR